MAEWLKAHAWKVCIPQKVSRVRIPLSPPPKTKARPSAGFCLRWRPCARCETFTQGLALRFECDLPGKSRHAFWQGPGSGRFRSKLGFHLPINFHLKERFKAAGDLEDLFFQRLRRMMPGVHPLAVPHGTYFPITLCMNSRSFSACMGLNCSFFPPATASAKWRNWW
jgi:hypothetical protein